MFSNGFIFMGCFMNEIIDFVKEFSWEWVVIDVGSVGF